MNKYLARIIIGTVAMIMSAACDSGPAPQPTAQPTSAATPQPAATQVAQPTLTLAPAQPTGTAAIVDAAPITPAPTPEADLPSPTPVTATSTGEAITALNAYALLKPKALEWQPDVRLAMLVNVRPGGQKRLLGGALGDPDVFEPTPGGKGRNWTLVAVSPSRGAVAISMDGAQVDLVAEGTITGEMLAGFVGPNLAALDIAALDPARLVDSDKIAEKVRSIPQERIGIALIAPTGLGTGPLPTPQSGGAPPILAYQAFSADPSQQAFTIFDAATGNIVLDSTGP